MTKKEASAKWCPMMRVRSLSRGVYDDPTIGEHNCCITDDCVLWIWYMDMSGGYCGLGEKH